MREILRSRRVVKGRRRRGGWCEEWCDGWCMVCLKGGGEHWETALWEMDSVSALKLLG